MSIDLEKLTPAPWTITEHSVPCFYFDAEGDEHCAKGFHVPEAESLGDHECSAMNRADATFIALARNDLDVKQRRGWHTEKCTDSDDWVVPQAAVAAMQLEFEKSGGSGSVPDSLPPTEDVFTHCYQRGHDVGLLTKADAWWEANRVRREPMT